MADQAALTGQDAGKAPQSLDEVMLAMDVVDTLRHQENLVSRELGEEVRDAQLLQRLRDIYRGQGIEVPDRILLEGVRALKEQRFAYTPPGPSFSRTVARAWINRGRVGRTLLTIAALLGLGWSAYQFGVVEPARQRAAQEQARTERERTDLAERLPAALEQGHEDVLREAQLPAARERADQILADGKAAIERKDAEGARQAINNLEALRADLRREYILRIVSRPGEPTGIWRVPPRNPAGRNYYLIVEPVAPDGRILSLPVTSEEDGQTVTTSKWGVRVSEATAMQVQQDKNDDGIVQRNRLGEKRRGYLDVDYQMPVLGGAILRW
ncbi:DUF6384 family protein [Methylobacterium nodulans]|uniref:Uncharacterized protein n=1 Tax=Methylobacterium nodulans (strain LMG 21967 / CNCM I-2342 / ORS 2060) TaxID=460265 RepID=B8IC64_METNO|nr:DUF6384 family protein [Methylobacterium nodulans]ACL61246.1 conserved hypothetical protein [Methylobacterium nodulans ORS 2060]